MNIAVIGGGIIGLSCAWRLAQAGARVRLLERGRCGEGATGASLGALWPPSPLVRGPLQEWHRRSLWRFEAFVDELRSASGLPISFRRSGRIEILNSTKAAARAREEAAAACSEWPHFGDGPVMEFMGPEMARERWPHVDVGEFGVQYCRATAMVRVSELVAALYEACRRAGVTIQESTPADSPSPAAFHADAVLITAGAYSAALADVAVRPAKGQGIALPPYPALTNGPIVKAGKTYLVPWHDEILVGSTTEPEAGHDAAPTSSARDHLQNSAACLVPALAGTVPTRHWAGLRPDAPHHLPIMGPLPARSGAYICTGHYKTGIGLAATVGELMTAAIVHQNLTEIQPFLPGNENPEKLKPT